ncbi:unnamed protein product [Durusdinium trenchii]|uniref:Mitochondrial carrier protein n=1 Tax=Durusdinium trenchii TaxID=1381693 RepID=A0ABP0JU08_9DINO
MASHPGRKLSVTENLFASGAAVVGATILTHPIDVVKVQLQMAEKSCVGALFSGLQAASLRAATYGSVRIGLCEPLQEKAGRSGGALLAGVLATVVGNPFEVLKVRLQAEPGRGELQVLRDMLKTEGCLVLASGFGWAATRSSLLTLSQVVPYAHAKTALQQWCGFSEGGALHVAASLMAGLVTTTVTAPVDVLKTKAMSSAESDVSAMLRAHGPFVFFKGWLANYVRLGPQTLFIFVFYEQARHLVECRMQFRMRFDDNAMALPEGNRHK